MISTNRCVAIALSVLRASTGVLVVAPPAFADLIAPAAITHEPREPATLSRSDTIFFSVPSVPLTDTLEWIRFVPPNGEDEHYLRYLQIAGVVRQYPWSLRGFSGHESRRLAARVDKHPWSGAPPFTHQARFLAAGPTSTAISYNSAFPYGSNDGPVWAGRGMTGSLETSIQLSGGPLSLVIAPIAFIAQNSSFSLLDNGQPGRLAFADPRFPRAIDRPQRFGDEAYGRADPGNSTLRLDLSFAAAGISTANMVWGPFDRYPFVLGNNAPGFAHAFIGTSRPLPLWIARLHGRVMWAQLEQSQYSPVEGGSTFLNIDSSGTRRFGSGLVAIIEPRGLPGLELGVTRFFHSIWPPKGIPPSYVRKPFDAFLKKSIPVTTTLLDPQGGGDNQLLSAFVRWVLPAARVEVYGEYGREDHSWDKRDLLQEPDHSRSYGLGLRHVLRARPGKLDGVGFELINFQLPHLARTLRGEGGTYVHGVMRQGHTNRGQLLGADIGTDAGAGFTMRWDRYVPSGRTSLAFHRIVRMERGFFWVGQPVDPKAIDVQYGLQAEKHRLLGRSDLTVGATLLREFNRNFADDAWSLSLTAKARVHFRR